MKTEIYHTHPKFILNEIGLFAWQRIDNDLKCQCDHKKSKHLDSTGICLDKSKAWTGICICQEFLLPGQTITILSNIPKKKIPFQKKEQEQTEDVVVKEGKVIQQGQDRFLREYGIV